MKKYAYIIAMVFLSFCQFCSANTDKEYISQANLVQSDGEFFYLDADDDLVLIETLYMDEDGFYILNVDYNRWNCRCCGYDLNIKKDYCAKCKGSRWWCE